MCCANVACGLDLIYHSNPALRKNLGMYLYHTSVGEVSLGKDALFTTIQGVDPIPLSEFLVESGIDPKKTPSKTVVRDEGEVSTDTTHGKEEWSMVF